MIIKRNESGRITKVKNEDGETVWTEEDSIRRDKISLKSQNELFEHIKNGEFKKYAKKTFEILTGRTVKEYEETE